MLMLATPFSVVVIPDMSAVADMIGNPGKFNTGFPLLRE